MNRDDRRKENQELFRMANERLEDLVAERLEPGHSVPFLCECADPMCMGRVDLTLEDYREVRSHERQFVMLAGHLRIAGEEIVSEGDGYEIAEKPD
jgi:hypothetical protein